MLAHSFQCREMHQAEKMGILNLRNHFEAAILMRKEPKRTSDPVAKETFDLLAISYVPRA